ncbi:MAG TPA: NADP-binding protein [Spirochaeta sp.]|nr:NADP-binding protein [Spirochaeta sp.]
MRKKVKILIWGFGAMGSGMARMLLYKQGVEISGVCDMHPQRVGKDLHSVIGLARDEHPEVIIQSSIEQALFSAPGTDLVLLATDSFTRNAFDKIMLLVSKGLNVISTAEEMAYPGAGEPGLAAKIDEAAKANGVSVLGTGINPGMIMDLLVVAMTGMSMSIDEITAERVNSLSPFGPAVMEEQGVGLSPDAFYAGAADGTIAGHVGFNESVNMIADAVGWKLSAPVEQTMDPIVSNVPRKTEYISINAGDVAGCSMKGWGCVGDVRRIKMIHHKGIKWVVRKYWRLERCTWDLALREGMRLKRHDEVPVRRHIKVRSTKSPFDGDWRYWKSRKRKLTA